MVPYQVPALPMTHLFCCRHYKTLISHYTSRHESSPAASDTFCVHFEVVAAAAAAAVAATTSFLSLSLSEKEVGGEVQRSRNIEEEKVRSTNNT